MTSYVVKPGDTMAKIEREKGLPQGKLQELNPGVNPRKLIPRVTILKVPASNR
jgi:LysM repeat protein